MADRILTLRELAELSLDLDLCPHETSGSMSIAN